MHLHKAMGISRLTSLVYIAVLALAGGCSFWNNSYVPALIKPHKVDIQQGNFVTQQDVDRLQIGMTRDQVRFILGTPLLNSPFHANRWDYVYRLTKADGTVVQYHYAVAFENDQLARHSGEKLPNNQAEFLSNK